MLDLYQHNLIAYEQAKDMLERLGRAAVIHPTGTGKSVVAYKFVETMPDKRFCWLSPSAYIMRTQQENIRRLEPNFCDDNVQYLTYAKLLYMEVTELETLQPDIIVLDEFHRCGAEEWGKVVDAFVGMYPKAKILGLSATSIRYLDNQRDMAEELFGGNIASEITLAESIATGILAAPKYVIAMYSYQKELERYRKRVESNRHRANYDVNRKYYEALRRALEKADGLDVVFDRYIKERSGKYIIFCSSQEHLHEVIDRIHEWFHLVDRNPHIYSVVSADPGSSEAFQRFKQDVSPNLKLLLCIDMLSEGIHVDDVAGVILLRPTVSPIVYKQQIGRALAAGKKDHPIIFDIVNNFDGLYNVSAFQSELRGIVADYRERGEGSRIVEDPFCVIDELLECRVLLQKLDCSLSTTWDVNYSAAMQYAAAYGDLNVPSKYRTETGLQLGAWIARQRTLYQSKGHGTLTEEQISKLEAIGMFWQNRYEQQWESMFEEAKEFYREHGHLEVPSNYMTENGRMLGRWVRRQIEDKDELPEDKKSRLESIGIVWSDSWSKRFEITRQFLQENPDYQISQATVIGDFWLGKWLVQQMRAKENGTLRKDRVDKIASLRENVPKPERLALVPVWEQSYLKAKTAYERYGTIRFAARSPEDKRVLAWLSKQRRAKEKGLLSEERIYRLEELDIDWRTRKRK